MMALRVTVIHYGSLSCSLHTRGVLQSNVLQRHCPTAAASSCKTMQGCGRMTATSSTPSSSYGCWNNLLPLLQTVKRHQKNIPHLGDNESFLTLIYMKNRLTCNMRQRSFHGERSQKCLSSIRDGIVNISFSQDNTLHSMMRMTGGLSLSKSMESSLNRKNEKDSKLFGSCIRHYATDSKSRIQNPMFQEYQKSLVEEYKLWNERSSEQAVTASSEKQQKEQNLRINFLRSAVEVIERLQKQQLEADELANIMHVEQDSEMKELISSEIHNIAEQVRELEEELVDVLVGSDPADNNDTILEVTAGVGGQEAMLFCAELFNMYCSFALSKGWSITGISCEENELGGTPKAIVEISGHDVYRHLKHEAGVHRVQRVPKTEKSGRVHTSTVSVSVLPQPRDIDIDIQQKDLKVETFRNSGPGGQSVNTTDSAVRITHLPTGTVSECRQERSQIKNRDIAMKNLKSRIYQAILEEQESQRKATRKMQMGSRGRSEKIRTYNFQQDRVTDHRLKENCSNLAEFMAGGQGLDGLIDSLNDLDKYQTLEAMLEEFEAESKKNKSGTKL